MLHTDYRVKGIDMASETNTERINKMKTLIMESIESPVMVKVEQNKLNQVSKQLEQFNTEILLCSEILHNAGYQYHQERLKKSYQELVECIRTI